MRAGCRKSARPVRRAGGGNVTTRETEAPALCESQSANGYSLRLRSARCPSTLRVRTWRRVFRTGLPLGPLWTRAGGSFPSVRGKPLGVIALPKLLNTLKIAAVPHDLRPSFRYWAAQKRAQTREPAEAVLAPNARNPIEAAYRHPDPFERRCRLSSIASRTEFRHASGSFLVPGHSSDWNQSRCSCSQSATAFRPTLSGDRQAPIQSYYPSRHKLNCSREWGHSCLSVEVVRP